MGLLDLCCVRSFDAEAGVVDPPVDFWSKKRPHFTAREVRSSGTTQPRQPCTNKTPPIIPRRRRRLQRPPRPPPPPPPTAPAAAVAVGTGRRKKKQRKKRKRKRKNKTGPRSVQTQSLVVEESLQQLQDWNDPIDRETARWFAEGFSELGFDRIAVLPAYASHHTGFRRTMKVKFRCPKCRNSWTSMCGRIRVVVLEEEDSFFVEMFGQQCRQCSSREWWRPKTYRTEVLRVCSDIVSILEDTGDPGFHGKKEGNMQSSHRKDLCEACQKGVCTRDQDGDDSFDYSDSDSYSAYY